MPLVEQTYPAIYLTSTKTSMQFARRWSVSATGSSRYWTVIRRQTDATPRYASSIPKNIKQFKGQTYSKREEAPRWNANTGQQRRQRNSARGDEDVQSYVNREPQSIHNDREIIDPLSLEKTLRAHQQANQESIIIRHARTNPFPNKKAHGPKSKTSVPTVGAHLDLEREDVQEGRGQWEDYTGSPRALSLDWEIVGSISRSLRVPWMKVLDERDGSQNLAATRLSEEMRAADVFFSPSQAEWEATNSAVKQLESFVLQVDRSYVKLDIIGSRASGLATPLSDLDLNLVVSENPEASLRNPHFGKLGSLFKVMKWGAGKKGQFNTAYFASRARVPIIVGTHISGLEFQIQSASSCYGSLEVVKHLCAEYPTVRALFKIIKQALKMRGLSDGHQGGLTSYPLINMIAVSLKRNAKSTDPFDYGLHLLQFLEYWSTIDLYKTGITHVPNSYFNHTGKDPFGDRDTAAKSIDLITQDPVGARPIEFDVRKDLAEIHEGQDNFMMTLHDPANPHNDLGRSAFAIKHIQSTFMDILSKLKKDMSAWDSRIRAESDAGKRPPSLLRSLIEGDYSLYNMERKRITAPREVVEYDYDPQFEAKFS